MRRRILSHYWEEGREYSGLRFGTVSTEVPSLENQLRDLRDLPSKNPPKNGMDSVSRGYVFLKEWAPGLWTPACVHFGAMNHVGPNVWRQLSGDCHCGAWWVATGPEAVP